MSARPTETRPKIELLPDALVNQIAAGEVVERPASVVKELVENSLDAYSSEVDVEIAGGGIEHMRVTDNGIGMDREAALLALRRHATSKIRSMADLTRVSTLGFRGEALPSIASVARVTLTTRPFDEAEATRVRVVGGKVENVAAVGAAPGTTVTVDDLFFNTPARRKFLKAPATESRRVAAWMTDFALGYPHIGFRYRSEGRDVLNVPPHAELLQRVGAVLGTPLVRALLPIDNRLDYIEVQGFVGRPDLAKSHRGQIYLYVNGRRIQDRTLIHALTAGYGEYLPQGRFPVAVVFLSLPPETVDVNVHPAKAEVRFLHPRMAHDAVYYTVNRALLSNRTVPSISPGEPLRTVETPEDSTTAPLRAAVAQILSRPRSERGGPQASLLHSLYRTEPGSLATDAPPTEERAGKPAATRGELRSYSADDEAVTGGVFYQFAGVYVIAPVRDALIVMDQHTAHERILFEAVSERINAELTVTQNLLFPISIELEPAAYETFEPNQDLFSRAGFQVRPFGHRTVLLEGAPAVLRGKAPDRYFREVLDELGSELKKGRDRLTALAASFACKAAVRAGDLLNESEMAALFDQLFATRNPYSCPHGRPTVVRIPRDELDRKFGRA
jgi:DNA mismatch repair protein MutL